MSAGFVADASVGIAWVVPSQSNAATDEMLEEVTTGTPLVVPILWPLETANSLLILFRRKKLLAQEREEALSALKGLPVDLDSTSPQLAFSIITELAVEHGLTIYDAVYLELALRRKLPLATRDAALCKAARDCRVKLLL